MPQGASSDAAHAAIKAAGGTVRSENTEVGVATVTTTNSNFAAQATAARAIDGVAQNRVIGRAPADAIASGEVKKFDPATADLSGAKASRHSGNSGKHEEPLADLQWDMKQIGATASGSQELRAGQGRAGRHHRHRRRRHPPGHRPELRHGSSAATSRRTSRSTRTATRSTGRASTRAASTRRTRTTTATARTWRRDRLAGQQPRDRRRGAQGDDRQPARRPGLRASSSCSRRWTP